MTVAASPSDLDVRASALLDQLESLRTTAVAPDQLDDWLGRWSRLEREVQTLWICHLLAIKRDANDTNARAQYKRLMSHWIPQIETQIDVLRDAACASDLAKRHPQLASRFEAEREESQSQEQLKLQSEEQILTTEYDAIVSTKDVFFEGRDLTVREALSLLEATTDRQNRQVMWQTIKRSELEVVPKLDALFAQLLGLRQNLAAISGAANYVEYVWQSSNRSYTPDEAVEFLNATAAVFADLTVRLDQERARILGVEQLKPWDLNVRLTPPSNVVLSQDDYLNFGEQIVTEIDPEFGAVVQKLRQERRFDLSPRAGKTGSNAAFLLRALDTTEIICNLTGAVDDLSALLHELGHAIHWHFLSPDKFVWDLNGDDEVKEFFAFVFQFLGCEIVVANVAIPQSDRAFYRRSALEHVLARLRSVDERVRMELWLYSQTGEIGPSEIDRRYLELYQRPAVSWSGDEDFLSKQWQHEHLFSQSFYNIEYSISTVAALLFLDMYHKNSKQAIKSLRIGMKIGLTQGFKSIFEAMGIEFPFHRDQIVVAKSVLENWLG